MICVVSFAAAFVQQIWVRRSAQMSPRAHILAQLKETNGRHLVIVRYGPRALLNEDWVHNDADIDGAMAGNLCRCGTYLRIRQAIHDAASRGRASKRASAESVRPLADTTA